MHGSPNCLIVVFLIFCKSLILASSSNISENIQETVLEDYLLCRGCGSDISPTNLIFSKESNRHLAFSNETIFGKTVNVQLVGSPQKEKYEIIVVKKATCAATSIDNNWKTTFSLFDGFAWKYCFCPRCSAHIGWMFEPLDNAKPTLKFPTDNGFYAIDIGSVIAETELKTIIATQYKQEL